MTENNGTIEEVVASIRKREGVAMQAAEGLLEMMDEAHNKDALLTIMVLSHALAGHLARCRSQFGEAIPADEVFKKLTKLYDFYVTMIAQAQSAEETKQ